MSILKIFEFLSELYGWLRIVISFSAVGSGIGAIIYYLKKDTLGLYLGVGVALIGFISGAIVATKTWKKGGTMHALSRTMASPELDNEEKRKQEELKL